MLIIRDAQMEPFAAAGRRRFEAGRLAHLQRFFPKTCARIGEPAVRASIRQGMERAARHGLTSEYDVARFLNLMYLLSFDYDEAPGTAWAGRLLAQRHWPPAYRMQLVWDRALIELTRREAAARDV